MLYQDIYYNYSNVTTYQPFNWIGSNISLSHEDSISPIPGQENKVEDRQSYNLLKLSPDAYLEYLRFPNWIYQTFHGSNASAGYMITKRRENNALLNYNENRTFGTFSQWSPFDGFLMPNFTLSAYTASMTDTKETSYQLSNETESEHLSYQTDFKYQPNINYLNIFSFDGDLEYSISNIETNLSLASGTTNITESQLSANKQAYGISARLPSIPILISTIRSPFIRYITKWDIKTDQNKTNSTDDSLDSSILNNSSVSTNILELNFSIFNKFNSKNSGTNEISYYNRNKTNSAQGSLFKQKQSSI